MSDAAEPTTPETSESPATDDTAAPDAGANASGSQSTGATTWDVTDSGQSDDIDNSLDQQGVSDRETGSLTARNESNEIADDEKDLF